MKRYVINSYNRKYIFSSGFYQTNNRLVYLMLKIYLKLKGDRYICYDRKKRCKKDV